MSFEIISDVSLDIDQEFLQQHNIYFVPMDYVLGEEICHCCKPESNEMMHEYYDKLRNKIPTQTSQITPFHYVEAFEPFAKNQQSLLYICLSSGLSTTYESARMAAEELKETYPGFSIEVVDSLGATGGMGLLTETAAALREQGLSLTECADRLRSYAEKINYWFMVEDLMYLKRGGRISAATALVGTALSIKPILTILPDGKLDTMEKKRGRKQAMRYLVDKVTENLDISMPQTAYICCSDCMKEAETLRDMIVKEHPQLNVKITMLSPIIGAHTGPNMLSIIFYGTKRI
ncbi:MAG: DegV family protein [Clostridiales bacterium]|nr:DegV family protein [Clostridiales bacterium]